MAFKITKRAVKNCLFFICGLFLVVAVFQVRIGLKIIGKAAKMHVILFGDPSFAIASFFHFNALTIIVIAVLGIIGVYKENVFLLNIFIGLLVLIVLLDGLSLEFLKRVKQEIIIRFDILYGNVMYSYFTCERTRRGIDEIQQTLQCCGNTSYTDWLEMSSTQNPDNLIPDSCLSACGKYFDIGCFAAVRDMMGGRMTLFEIIILIIMELIGIFAVFTLVKLLGEAKEKENASTDTGAKEKDNAPIDTEAK